MDRKQFVQVFVLGLCLTGCSTYGSDGNGNDLEIDPAKIAPACAAFTACFGVDGMSRCADYLDTIGRLDIGKMSLAVTMLLTDGGSFPRFAVAQNIDCVVEAGADCEAVKRCLNQGRPAQGCSLPPGEFEATHCVDSETIEGCTDWSGDGQTLQVIVDCSSLGLECIDINEGEGTIATCAREESQIITQGKVTCQGSVATLHILNLSMTMDCAFYRSDCQEGSFSDIEHMDFCRGTGPTCEESTFEEYCVSDTMVGNCLDGVEAGLDCGRFGRECVEFAEPDWTDTTCVFPGCNASDFVETCVDGAISFCGPGGDSTVSCTDLGFSGCAVDWEEARCVE